MHKVLRTGFVLTLGLGGLAACGGSAGIAVEDLDDEFAAAMCDYLVGCGIFETQADCRANLSYEGIDPDLIAGVDNGSIDYDSGAAKDCLDSISGWDCASLFGNDDGNESCDNTFTGTIADGAGCFLDEQCVSARCVEPDGCADACCEGTCGPEVADAAIGGDCAEADCVAGAYCDDQDVCAARSAQGETCAWAGECQSGLVCASGEVGTCESPPVAGDPCLGEGCGGVLGLTCDFSTTTCQPVLYEGDACDIENDLCSRAYLLCEPESSTCAPFPGVGESCAAFQCGLGAYCDYDFELGQGTCVVRGGDGAACEGDWQCLDENCDGEPGTCKAPAECIGTGA